MELTPEDLEIIAEAIAATDRDIRGPKSLADAIMEHGWTYTPFPETKVMDLGTRARRDMTREEYRQIIQQTEGMQR